MGGEFTEFSRHGDTYDEVVERDGSVRPVWRTASSALGVSDPHAMLQRRMAADRLLDAQGSGHLVHELTLGEPVDRRGSTIHTRSESRPWRLDPIPFVIDETEFSELSGHAVERMRALEAFLADCYGPQLLVAEGILSPEKLYASSLYRPAIGGPGAVHTWLRHYSIDVIRDASGCWKVVQDLTDMPSGCGYALMNREVSARTAPDAIRLAQVAPISEHAQALRDALAEAAPMMRSSPRIVVLTSGPTNPTYVEHSYLAARLGYHLVESGDVVMRSGRLWLRALSGLEPIDVVYRRVSDDGLDPLEPGHDGHTPGIPGVVWGARRGGVSLANGYGSGLAEDLELTACLPEASQRLLGRALGLETLPSGSRLATSPVLNADHDPTYDRRSVVLRLHVTLGSNGHAVMPGGTARVLSNNDDPRRPTSRLSKDVWVVGAAAVPRVVATNAIPQVDFGTSVPTRVADALYWLGRAAERAETAARSARVINAQLEQDPLLCDLDDSSWGNAARALLASASGEITAVNTGNVTSAELQNCVRTTVKTVATQIGRLVHEATTVREYLSSTTGQVLRRLGRLHNQITQPEANPHEIHDEALGAVLVELAAFSGLTMESTVRGPAWTFLDIGRRIERSLANLGSLEATLGQNPGPATLQSVAESLLEANESMVAYRRRYRSDVEFSAVIDMLLRDFSNPRSLAFQLQRLSEHATELDWPHGVAIIQQAQAASHQPIHNHSVGTRSLQLDAVIFDVRDALLNLTAAISARWFAAPVNPTVSRGR